MLRSRQWSGQRLLVGSLASALVLMGLVGPVAAQASSPAHSGTPAWKLVHSGGTADLRAISPVTSRVVWASGSGGTVLRTTNGGRTWREVGPPGTSNLEFRGLKAFDADNAVLMSVGNHSYDFRIYVTSDGGRTWTVTNRNGSTQAFYDCMAFFNRERGLVLSDPVNGRFRILITTDGGLRWRIDPSKNMPPAHKREYGFAASNTCITTLGSQDAWFGSGGAGGARVYRSTDGGVTWAVAATPMRRGAPTGIFSVAFRTPLQGLAIGGDFSKPSIAPRALALTADGGQTWTLVGAGAAPDQYRSGAAWVPRTAGTALAVGLTGSDVTTDGGYRWTQFDDRSFDAVVCTAGASCWASGADEHIGVLARG